MTQIGSEFPQGADWIKHTDGRWYPPGPSPEEQAEEAASAEREAATAAERKKKKDERGCLIGLVAAVALISFWFYAAGSSNEPDMEPRTGDKYGAIDVCQNQVRQKLKSPRSAKFSAEIATDKGSGVWEVTGAVDADNSFGASIRNRWTCSAIHQSGQNWQVRATLIE